MRRWIATLFLALTVFYLGAAGMDRCDDSASPDCVQVCHILCTDGCAVAPLPSTPTPPRPDQLPRDPYDHERAPALVTLVIEPEKDPPKG